MANASGLFGIGNGGPLASGSPVPNDEAPKQVQINPNATPVEIIAAWKAQKLAERIDPNEAFVEQFKSQR